MQTIDSAPKDGTVILLLDTTASPGVQVGAWAESIWDDDVDWQVVDMDGDIGQPQPMEPTHWMDIPKIHE